MSVIDSHLHVWSGDVSRYPFAAGRKAAEPAPAEDLLREMDAAGVERAAIVQPIHYLYDNRYVADCLRAHPGRFAAVALIDQQAPDAPAQLEALVKEHGFGGLRIHLASRVDDPADWAAADQDPLWERAEALGTSFCVHGPTRHLRALEPIVARFPGVKVVLDHQGGAPLPEADEDGDLAYVAGWSRYANVYVKWSPQPHKSQQDYPHRDTFGLYRALLDAYGARRCMWGTNYPGVMRSTGYAPALALFREHLDFLSEEERAWVLGRTAESVWFA